MNVSISLLAFVLFAALGFAQQPQQPQPRFPTDPATGRAIGAKQTTPEQLRSLIDKNSNTLIIDVREPDEFEKETIKGAANIPLGQLESRLKDLPKDATLVFT